MTDCETQFVVMLQSHSVCDHQPHVSHKAVTKLICKRGSTYIVIIWHNIEHQGCLT